MGKAVELGGKKGFEPKLSAITAITVSHRCQWWQLSDKYSKMLRFFVLIQTNSSWLQRKFEWKLDKVPGILLKAIRAGNSLSGCWGTLQHIYEGYINTTQKQRSYRKILNLHERLIITKYFRACSYCWFHICCLWLCCKRISKLLWDSTNFHVYMLLLSSITS